MRTLRLGRDEARLAIEAVRTLKRPDGGISIGREAMERFLDRPANVLVVAVDGADPIGFLLAYVLDRLDSERSMVCLYEIVVDPDRRGIGVGTRLIEALEEVSAGIDVTKIWTVTNASNQAAVRLFAGTGADGDPGGDDVVFTYGEESRT